MSNYDKAVEGYAVHLYKLNNKPWKDPYSYTMEYTGSYTEDMSCVKIYNWQDYEEIARDAVDYFYGGKR